MHASSALNGSGFFNVDARRANPLHMYIKDGMSILRKSRLIDVPIMQRNFDVVLFWN